MSSGSASDWWSDGSVSIEFQDSNPKKHGSQAYERYESYKPARSVADATKHGATRDDLQNDYKKGFLKMTGKTPQGKIRRKGQSPFQQLDGMEEEAGDDEGDEDDGRHPTIKRELDFDPDPRQDRLIAAIDKLTQKVDNLAFTSATKKDLQDFVHHTEQYVAEKLKPVTDEISELRQRIGKMETTGPARAAASPELSRVMERLNKLDPALKSITAIGFDVMDLQDRTRTLRNFMNEHFKDIKFTTVDTIMKGPYNDRKATKVSYIEFPSRHDVDVVLRGIESKGLSLTDSSGTPLRFARAKTHVQLPRNYALKKAKDLVEKHAAAKNKAVSINWKNRAVEVDGKDVFTQDKNDTAGKFMQPFMVINLE